MGIRDSGHIHTCTETHIHIHTHSDVASCTHCYTHEFHKPTSMYSLTLNSLLTSVYSAIHFNSHFTCVHNHTPTSQHSAPSHHPTPLPRTVVLASYHSYDPGGVGWVLGRMGGPRSMWHHSMVASRWRSSSRRRGQTSRYTGACSCSLSTISGRVGSCSSLIVYL